MTDYEYGTCNFIEIDCRLPWRSAFVFVDTDRFLADRIFIDRKIPVRFKKEMARDDTDYVLVFCSTRRKDRKTFAESMGFLERKMLLSGRTDYSQFCRDIFAGITNENQTK